MLTDSFAPAHPQFPRLSLFRWSSAAQTVRSRFKPMQRPPQRGNETMRLATGSVFRSVSIHFAIAMLALGASAQPARADLYSDANQRATERESQGKLDEAAEVLEEIAPQYAQDLDLTLRMAWLRFRATSYRRALSHYRQAERISPESSDARLGIGWTLQRLGRCDDARPYFEALLAQHPDHGVAKDGLAACPSPKIVSVQVGALFTGMAYSGHYLRTAGVAVSPRAELSIAGKWRIGAAYRYSEFFLKTAPLLANGRYAWSTSSISQNEAYAHAGYVSSTFGLLGRYAFTQDSRGSTSAGHHIGASLRVSYIGDAQLHVTNSIYSDLLIVRAAPSWRLPIGKGFSVQLGGVGQWASGSLLGSGVLELSFVRSRINLYAGGSYGEQIRPAQLEIQVITNMQERIAASAWGGLSIQLPYDFNLLADYRYDRLRRLSDIPLSSESNAHYFTLGLSKAF